MKLQVFDSDRDWATYWEKNVILLISKKSGVIQSELLGSVNVCRASSVIMRRQQFALNDNSSYTAKPILIKHHRNDSKVILYKTREKIDPS